jgi:hypothetical protein
VEILREEMFKDAVSKDNDNTNLDQNFEIVIDKYRHKKSRNNKNEKCKTVMKMQQHQTFPTTFLSPCNWIYLNIRINNNNNTENKYSTLVNLHDEKESSKIDSKIINTSLSLNKVSRKKRKLFILGDSHSRGMAAELSFFLGNDFEVNETVMPGARLENITKLSDEGISTLDNNDAVIIWAGSNDIKKNETNKGLSHLKNFVITRQNTNIVLINAPHRFALQESSCVNKEVEVFNRKLHKIIILHYSRISW